GASMVGPPGTGSGAASPPAEGSYQVLVVEVEHHLQSVRVPAQDKRRGQSDWGRRAGALGAPVRSGQDVGGIQGVVLEVGEDDAGDAGGGGRSGRCWPEVRWHPGRGGGGWRGRRGRRRGRRTARPAVAGPPGTPAGGRLAPRRGRRQGTSPQTARAAGGR